MAKAIAQKYRSPICIVHTKALERQATQRLGRTYTIQRLLRSGWPKGVTKPDLVVWDECHHSASDEWAKLAAMFPRAKILGLTATPQRADGRGLELFDRMVVAAQYSHLLEQGVIVPARVFVPEKELDGSDPDPVNAYTKYAPRSRALFFLRRIADAEVAARRLGPGHEPWHSAIPPKKRDRLMKAFRDGKLRALLTVDALTEGLDVPGVQTVVLSSPCQHVGTYLQRVGRGLRAFPGLDHMSLLDLCSASLRHGSPTADRTYTIGGLGIGPAMPTLGVKRGSYTRIERGQYDARLVEVHDWSSPVERQRATARLRALAMSRGYPEKAVDEAARRLFG